MRICVVGDPEDLTAAYVGWVARREGFDVIILDESRLGTTWTYRFEDRRPESGHLLVNGGRLEFSTLDGAYVRFCPQPGPPAGLSLPRPELAALIVERRAAIEHLLESLPCVVANRPSSGRSNGSKPHQMRLLRQAGFDVPPWIATNRPAEARSFARAHKEGTVYKACSGLRSRVRSMDQGLLRRLSAGTTPIVLQAYVPGREVRVHVVGRKAFATEVESSGIDYRFHQMPAKFRPTIMPSSIETRCRAFARAEGLTIVGFDFRVAGGRWFPERLSIMKVERARQGQVRERMPQKL